VTGIVQGVGFRPFVYRVASGLSLVGYVLNLGDAGVRIVVEGARGGIDELIKQLRSSPPSISRIDSVDIEWGTVTGSFDSFSIRNSLTKRSYESAPELPPDIAICDDCVEELRNSSSRWYQYPFTSCAACGPRYSTITNLPYDRPSTTMVDFPLCNVCNTGYTSPLDRRYHAQTTACDSCGPKYQLYGADGMLLKGIDCVDQAARLLEKNAVLALHGIGGTHLVTKISDYEPIRVLRERKNRLQRPFAIMAKNTETLSQFSAPTENELRLMSTWRRPIVLVKKRVGLTIPEESLEEISPGLDTLGVMLPYAPLHHFLFDNLNEDALVMTSANPTGVPMYIDPSVIVSELGGVADYFLLHNRRIHQRADDSVVKFVDYNSPVFIRRARGYVPEPLAMDHIHHSLKIVAVGPEKKSTGAVLKSKKVYMTQHIGDTSRVENIDFLRDSINHLMLLLGVDGVDAFACDLHPEFLSTELAEQLSSEMNVPLYRVQHHHAHLASMIMDHKMELDTSIVCITTDGYGYGPNGEGWGGDILVGNGEEFLRRGGLTSSPYPGGDLSARYAARSLIGILGNAVAPEDILTLLSGSQIASDMTLSKETLALLLRARKQDINVLQSTSLGRFLDAVTVALGICAENSYDGECPMKLEAHAIESEIIIESNFVSSGNTIELDPVESLPQILELKKKHSNHKIAFAAQRHIGEAFAEMACRIADDEGIEYIGFSGGVALNRIITSTIVDVIKSRKKKPLIHKMVPPGDGGVSAGQSAVAAARSE
jgi:hydrogenase maturation protein HypF